MAQVTTAGAVVSSRTGPTSGNNDGASCVDNNNVDLAVLKTATPTVAPSGTVTFTLTVTNNGPGISSGGFVTDVVPSAYTGVTVDKTAYPNCAVSGNTVTCQNGVLNPGDSYDVQITAKAPGTTQCITNSATVTGSNEADPVPANNTSSAQTCISDAKIDVAKAAGGATVTGPDGNGNYTASYTVTVRNTGTGTIAGLYGPLVDTPAFSSGVSIVSFSWAGGPTGAPATAVTADATGSYTFGTAGTSINSGGVHIYTVTVVVKQAPTASSTLTLCNGTAGNGLYNTVGADGESASASTTNNSACVNPAPAINVVKNVRLASGSGNGVDSLTVNRGDQVVYVYAVSLPTGYTEPVRTVTVTDDKLGSISGLASPAGYKSGDTNTNNQLDPGETWLYWSAATAPANSVDNVGTATGTGLTTNRSATATDTAHLTVLFPTLDVAKTAGALTGPDANGVYTAAYTVTVSNTGTGAGSYGPVTDTLGFDPNLTPKTATWTKGAATGTTTFGATGPFTFTVGPNGTTALAAGATDTYAVSVTFTYSGASAAALCGGPGTGLYNSVALPTGQESNTSNNSACTAPPPRFGIQKLAQGGTAGGTGTSVQTAADGTASVTYTVIVTNTGSVAAKHPAITDSVTLPTGFAVTSVTVGGTAQTLTGGSFAIPASAATIAPGGTASYSIVVNGKAADLTAVDWTKAATCNTTGGGTPSAGGFFNLVSMVGDSDGSANNDACAPVTKPTQVVKVNKLGTTCAGGATTCPLPGATFAIYATDPSQAGATPIANGITADVTGGAAFTSAALAYPGTYWLVETKSPGGYELLAQPIRFTLGSSGITLVGAPTSVMLAPGSTTTIQVVDSKAGRLPAAGGHGPLRTTLLGLLIVALGAAYTRRPSGRRAPGLTS
nr:SpaA isopeptide-forming pilin-related protein [Knoellia sp. DB2414S]